jgi:proline iminopeptidase
MLDGKPRIRPFDAISLNVGDGHWLYVEQCGRPDGIPVLFLHGGPGSGAQYMHRELFDPDRFHAILFDQRGAGRSHPYLSRSANTTQHLIADIEAIRRHFGIEKWIVLGGSWGSTLAIAYAEAHPDRVAGLVLRAIFLGTDEEVEWAFIEGPKRFRPELYREFVEALPEDERAEPLRAYVERLNYPERGVHGPAAHVWNSYERALSELRPASAHLHPMHDDGGRLPPTPLIEAHYIANSFFLQPGELLANAHRLAGIPGVMVQGRYDLLCPPVAAEALAQAWPGSRLTIISAAGHAMTEPGVTEALRDGLMAIADQV